MRLSAPTLKLLAELDVFSGRKLSRRDDLGLMLELALVGRAEDALADLSFQAKFLSRAYGLMKRIGTQGDGYERLASEFSRGITTVRETLRVMLGGAPVDERDRFVARYLADTPEALQELMELSYTLSWHKNWLLDHS